MSEIINYLSDYLKELDSYMKRLTRSELSRKDQKLFFELSNEYYDIFQQTEGFPKEVLEGISEFIDNIMNQSDGSKDLAEKYRDNIVLHADKYIDTSLRTELQFGVFQKDVEISRLQSEKIQMLQELTNLDMKIYGEITEQTQEILAVQNCEVLNGRVRELGLWEQNNSTSGIETNRKEEIPDKADSQQRVRLKFPYMTRDTFMAVKNEIKRMGAEYDGSRKGWYVSQSLGKEVIVNIQEYIADHDEAIYLKLPSTGPEEFKSMLKQLKQDGARFNSDKKLWFITENLDSSKFQQYLSTAKDSIHEKLSGYRKETEKQYTDNSELGSRRKDMPERV